METVLGVLVGVVFFILVASVVWKILGGFAKSADPIPPKSPSVPPQPGPKPAPGPQPGEPQVPLEQLDPTQKRVNPHATRGRIYKKEPKEGGPGQVSARAKPKVALKPTKVWRKETGQWEDPYPDRRSKYAHKFKRSNK